MAETLDSMGETVNNSGKRLENREILDSTRETLFANKQHEEFFSSNRVQREASLILR